MMRIHLLVRQRRAPIIGERLGINLMAGRLPLGPQQADPVLRRPYHRSWSRFAAEKCMNTTRADARFS